MTKLKEHNEWEERFVNTFVSDGVLDCIPEKNWAEMEDEVFGFIRTLLAQARREERERLVRKIRSYLVGNLGKEGNEIRNKLQALLKNNTE